MSNDDRIPVEHNLIRDATIWDFEITKTEIEPTVGDDDFSVRIEFQVEEEGVEHCGFSLIYTLAMLSFHDARPRGVSGEWFEDDDQLTANDLLRYLEFTRGKLHLYVDYLRGRCVKTSIEIDKGGKILLQTVNRGQAATRWVERLRGKKTLQPVSSPAGG